jgi:hypothetical protein
MNIPRYEFLPVLPPGTFTTQEAIADFLKTGVQEKQLGFSEADWPLAPTCSAIGADLAAIAKQNNFPVAVTVTNRTIILRRTDPKPLKTY